MNDERNGRVLAEIRTIARQCNSLSAFLDQTRQLFAREFTSEDDFLRFFHSGAYRQFVELLVADYGKSLNPNHPEAFLQLVPVSARSQLNQWDIEHGLFGAHWGRGASELLEAIEHSNPSRARYTGPLSLYFDLDDFTPSEIAEVLASLSELYRSVGGDALVIDNCYFTGVQELAGVPQ